MSWRCNLQFVNDTIALKQERASKIYSIIMLVSVYLSIMSLVVDYRYQHIYEDWHLFFFILEKSVFAIFALDIFLKLALFKDKIKYFCSFDGIVDIITVIPDLVSLVFVGAFLNFTWLRSLRILRFCRAFRLFAQSRRQAQTTRDEVIGVLLPWAALAVALKAVVLALEGQAWWPGFGDLGLMISVTGFVIGAVLGLKLNVARGRLYDIEDAASGIVGSLRDLSGVRCEVDRASLRLLASMEAGLRPKVGGVLGRTLRAIRKRADVLERELARAGLGGPATTTLHRDIEFIVQRAQSRMPDSLEKFLNRVTIIYVAIVIIALPGFIGFVGVLFVIYVLGGLAILVDALDRPFDADQGLVRPDFSALVSYRRGLAPATC